MCIMIYPLENRGEQVNTLLHDLFTWMAERYGRVETTFGVAFFVGLPRLLFVILGCGWWA